MSSQITWSSTPRKAAKRERKPKSSSLFYFWQNISHICREPSFYDMLRNFASKTFSVFFWKQACISHLRSAGSKLSFVNRMMEGILSSFISSICLSVCGCHSHLYLFYRCKELLYQTFLRAVQPNCNNFFQTKKTNSSLYLFIYEWRNTDISPTGFYFKNNRSIMNHGWRVSDVNFCKPQKVPGHNHQQPLPRWWHFCCLSTNGNFPFLEKFGNKLFTF